MFAAVRYEDVYVREDDMWRFTSRKMRTVHAGPWAEVGTSLTAELPIRRPGGWAAAPSYSRWF